MGKLRVSMTKVVRKRIFKKKRVEVKRNKHGQRLCEPHNNIAYYCNTFPCHGAGICDCGKQKSRCGECGGGSLCKCGTRRSICTECRGGEMCKCDPPKQKRQCEKCMPNTRYAYVATKCICGALKVDQKECKYDDVLGMSVGDYRTWIEAKWINKDWSWANYGKVWVLDHIEALGIKANKDDVEPSRADIVRRLHYSNTQPLGAIENKRKAAKPVATKL